MELTGKCLEDFKEWGLQTGVLKKLLGKICFLAEDGCLNDFFKLPDFMKYGAYEDFFDSVGVVINIDPILSFKNEIDFFWVFINDDLLFDNGNDEFKTRPEARIKAIEKANNIYNELNSTEL